MVQTIIVIIVILLIFIIVIIITIPSILSARTLPPPHSRVRGNCFPMEQTCCDSCARSWPAARFRASVRNGPTWDLSPPYCVTFCCFSCPDIRYCSPVPEYKVLMRRVDLYLARVYRRATDTKSNAMSIKFSRMDPDGYREAT